VTYQNIANTTSNLLKALEAARIYVVSAAEGEPESPAARVLSEMDAAINDAKAI
jgi:hypothetical protein